ncbi:Ribonucleotide reductase of class III (anaerobic), activating protein [hydrothermal vent metagenome]|uniref:Ribonucleotide reductase of class III (Anaerobic), activating protein n=1 Tax=hydrothermal vent metagenome TaxID=652676 RepID=A0A1W1BFP8_9ZZZZ
MNTDSEFNLKNDKVIYDITKFTHLDYPDHLACIFWFAGCNMRCDYCYNKEIVFAKNGAYSLDDALAFLRTRESLLDGVVLSGGEASLQELIPFCQAIKKLGFAIKLDTNGTNPQLIKELITRNLLDYIALDYKASKNKFQTITHSRNYDAFSKTLTFLIEADFNFEVRTTLHADLLNEEDMQCIIKDLQERNYNGIYYIQEFRLTQENIGALQAPKKSFDKSSLHSDIEIVWR